MASRLWGRLLIAVFALFHKPGKKIPDQQIKRLLVINHLLLGDTLMLTPLLKRLRHQYPQAEIVFVCPEYIMPLYSGRPYAVSAKGFDPRNIMGIARLITEHQSYDIAFVPGDNRWAQMARAMGARWIIAFWDSQTRKNHYIDELVPWPETVTTWGDTAATLVKPALPDLTYTSADWPAPDYSPFELPGTDYIVLHLGASKQHKYWSVENWHVVAEWIREQGLAVVWSVGQAEVHLLSSIAVKSEDRVFAGTLALNQLWQLLKQASALVCPDTGIAHLGRIVDVPTIVLFGPGSPLIFGAGRFWQNSQFFPIWHEDVSCRDQTLLFGRDLPWVRQCWRGDSECRSPFCTNLNQKTDVINVLRALFR